MAKWSAVAQLAAARRRRPHRADRRSHQYLENQPGFAPHHRQRLEHGRARQDGADALPRLCDFEAIRAVPKSLSRQEIFESTACVSMRAKRGRKNPLSPSLIPPATVRFGAAKLTMQLDHLR